MCTNEIIVKEKEWVGGNGKNRFVNKEPVEDVARTMNNFGCAGGL